MIRLGLQARFLLTAAVGLALLLVLAYGVWRLERSGTDQLISLTSGEMRAQSQENLERRGLVMAELLADSLTNPMYFVDLKAIGEIAKSALRQPDMEYVLVFDRTGHILHDGSSDIVAFGREMSDPFAGRAVASTDVLVQTSEYVIEVTRPIFLGDEKLGGVRVGISRAEAARIELAARDALSEKTQALGQARMRALIWPLLGVVCLLVLGLLLVARGLVRPARLLAQAAQQMERGRYDTGLNSDRGDEIGELIRSFGRLGQSLAEHHRDVRRLAYLDTLTGMPNRLMLRESLARALLLGQSNGTALALLFIDIDDFKRINDTLGHDAGDIALGQLAQRLETCLEEVRDQTIPPGQSIDLIARFGGDEFVALVSGSDIRERARSLAERILDSVRQPLIAGSRPVHLNASIGITLFPDDAADAQQLLKNGDIAMYQAKVHGKNCFRFFTNYMTKLAEDRLALEQDLRAAMAADQIEVHYQPIVDLASDRIVGAEALLRWNHPARGLVPSSHFVAIAEDFGLIEQLGRFAMRRACEDAAAWPELHGEQPFVSVNLSVRQLRQPDLPAEIAATARQFGIVPARLHVELTESALLDDEPLAISALAELRRHGVQIWLDDFGTGFSGLSHLRRVPVDGVKIDKSFIQDLLTDRDDLALTSAIVAMARSLGIEAVAEGVESASQLEILRSLRCDLGQGYWLGYPMNQAEMLLTLRAASDRGKQARG